MTFLSRTLPGLFILAILLLGFAGLSPKWLVEVCNPTFLGECISLFEELRKGERLSRENRAEHERTCIRGIVLEELVSGETTLFEAASWFRALYEEPQAWHNPDYPQPGHDDGERWRRLAIDRTENGVRFSNSPGGAEVLRWRLEWELREHLQRHGTVKLPDVTE